MDSNDAWTNALMSSNFHNFGKLTKKIMFYEKSPIYEEHKP